VKRVALLSLLLVACGRTFLPGDHIDRTRVVAARVHAAGDPTRAWLLPGEHATVEYLVVSPPHASDPMTTSFVACNQASAAGLNGITGCVDANTFDAASASVASAVAPTLDHSFDVPTGLMPGLSTYVLTYLGTCIGDGTATIDAITPSVSCTNGDRNELYSLAVQIVPDVRLANRNPNLQDDRIFLGDLLWEPPDPNVPAAGCASMASTFALPTVRLSGPADPVLVFGVSPDDREMYPAYDADGHPTTGREHIDMNHFVTAGRIAASTRIDDNDASLIASTTWRRPITGHPHQGEDDLVLDATQLAALPTGLLVRFWFVARDGRKGADWTERDLCLVP